MQWDGNRLHEDSYKLINLCASLQFKSTLANLRYVWSDFNEKYFIIDYPLSNFFSLFF